MSISTETFFLDPSAVGTLQARIQQMVAQGILAGRFRPGERLPSSRMMAQHLGVSRITVTLAYTELVADDYLTARGRSGVLRIRQCARTSCFCHAADPDRHGGLDPRHRPAVYPGAEH